MFVITAGRSAVEAVKRVKDKIKRAATGFLVRAPQVVWETYDMEIERVFNEEGDPPWAPLAPYTRYDRARSGFPPDHPILYRTGSYKQSFLADTSMQEQNIGGESKRMMFSSPDERFPWHQYGTRFMPARPVTPTTKTGRIAFCRKFAGPLIKELVEQIKNA